MNDLVERLREVPHPLLREAAAEIEQLRRALVVAYGEIRKMDPGENHVLVSSMEMIAAKWEVEP